MYFMLRYLERRFSFRLFFLFLFASSKLPVLFLTHNVETFRPHMCIFISYSQLSRPLLWQIAITFYPVFLNLIHLQLFLLSTVFFFRFEYVGVWLCSQIRGAHAA